MSSNGVGKNIIFAEEQISWIRLVLHQLTSPLIYILIFAGIVTFILQEFTDSIIIFVAVAINTGLGFYQEYKAETTLVQLKKLLVPKAMLVTGSERRLVDATSLQVGDIVEMGMDYQIPADGIILQATNLSINEAVLTGEALPVYKQADAEVSAGTTIVTGTGRMQVTAIGTATKIGAIGTKLSGLSETQTPLQLQLTMLARTLSVIVVIASIFLTALGIVLGYSWSEIFSTAVAVAVASIPEGLVITLTVILVIGMQMISKRKAVVRKLLAAETLGSVTTICVDKTGTITEGELSVVKEDFVNKEEAYLSILLSNERLDPLEFSMYDWLQKSKDPVAMQLETKFKKYEQIDGITFDAKHKFTAKLIKGGEQNLILVFGAPEVVLRKTNATSTEMNFWEKRIDSYATEAKRVLGFAYKYVDRDSLEASDIDGLTWNGLLAFDDPIRRGIHETFTQCASAGIKVKMITGDYLETAKAVALTIGLLPADLDDESMSKLVMTGKDLDKLSTAELSERIKDVVVFARTDPFQKLKIVEALKQNDEVIAMTGDGVNDAPALKAADIGIVVNEASDISKSTADIVLLDSNFKTIVHAVEEGRAIFDNIKKVVLYLLSGSFSELILVVGSLILSLPLPITAVQILWINLIEDSLPALSFAFEPKESDLLKTPPRPKNAQVLDKQMQIMILAFVLLTDLVLLAAIYFLSIAGIELITVRTVAFVGLGLNSLIYIFACKSLRQSVLKVNVLNNKFMLAAVAIGVVLLVAGVHLPLFNSLLETVPLALEHWLGLIVFAFFNLVMIEAVKAWAYRNN
jgi:P-type Ca2+ transporter type 2C